MLESMAATSYYDAIGLLAVCDSIESVEGIPLNSFSSLKQTADLLGPLASPEGIVHPSKDKTELGTIPRPYVYPPLSGQEQVDGPAVPPLQHLYLSHMPAHLSSGILYTHAMQQQQQAMMARQELASSQPPAAPRPNQPPGPAAATRQQGAPQQPPVPAGQQSTLSRLSSPYGAPHASSLRNPVLTPRPSAQLQRATVAPGVRKTVVPGSAGSSSVAISGEYKSEKCPICGRAFLGPKASTHKQQHIRRLHPEDYMPKRGGKKRLVLGGYTSSGGNSSPSSTPGPALVPLQPLPKTVQSPTPE